MARLAVGGCLSVPGCWPVLLAASLFTSTVLAHEFWLQPASYRVAVGAPVPVRLLVGAGFAGTPWPRPTRRVARFVRLGAGADSTDLRPALLADSVAPAVRCPAPGPHLVALVSQPAFSELPAAQFTAYLRAAGLGEAERQREAAGQAGQPGREAYQRCAKTLLLAGAPTAADTTYRRVLGLPLELVPEQNPYLLQPGAALTVRLLQGRRPVPGALLQLWAAGQPLPFATHTNRAGRALLRLPGPGPYLLAAVQLTAAPATRRGRADWCSTWATLTFGGPAPAPGRAN